MYKIVKLYWFNIVDNVEFVGLINDIFVFDVFYLCIEVNVRKIVKKIFFKYNDIKSCFED